MATAPEALIARLRDEVAREDYWTNQASFEKWKTELVAVLRNANCPSRDRFEHPVLDDSLYPGRPQASDRERFQQEVHAHVHALQTVITDLKTKIRATPSCVECPDCGRSMSVRARTCPFCDANPRRPLAMRIVQMLLATGLATVGFLVILLTWPVLRS